MGYELEVEAGASLPQAAGDAAGVWLEDRWQRSGERLAAALAHYRSLRGRVGSAEPAWQAAQLHLAEARQRQQELYDEIVRLTVARAGTGEEF